MPERVTPHPHNIRVRASLMQSLQDIVQREGLTQAAAAKRFGVTQPRVSYLMRHRIDQFSLDTLVRMLATAGLRVEVTVVPEPPGPANC